MTEQKRYRITLFFEGEIEIEATGTDGEHAYRKAVTRVQKSSDVMRVRAPKWVGLSRGVYKAEEIQNG